MKNKSKVTIFVAQIISLVFNPFLIVLLSIFFSLKLNSFSEKTNLYILFLILIIFGFFPLFLVSLKEMIKIKNLELSRIGRSKAYFVGIIANSLLLIVFSALNSKYFFVLAFSFSVFWGIMFILNLKVDKISLHTSLFCFSVIYLFFTLNHKIIILFLPLIFYSRLVLKKHSLKQLILGSIAGFVSGFITFAL